MVSSLVSFTYQDVEVTVQVHHDFSCTEEEVIELAAEKLNYQHHIDVMFYDGKRIKGVGVLCGCCYRT